MEGLQKVEVFWNPNHPKGGATDYQKWLTYNQNIEIISVAITEYMAVVTYKTK